MVKKIAKAAPNVILLVPIFQAEDLFDEWASHIKRLNPLPSTIVFCENNSTDKTLEKICNFKIKGVKIELIRFWTIDPRDKKMMPFEECYNLIAHARQLLLTRARHIDPDYAIFIDSDIMLMDEDTINSLIYWEKDIIGGAYLRIFPVGQAVATLFYSSRKKEKVKKWVKLKKLDSGVLLWQVHATSGGCLCLSRKLIQDRRVDFYPVPEGYSEDFGYCKQAQDNGYQVFLDGMLKVGHKIRLKWRAWDVIREKDDEKAKNYDHGTLIQDLQKVVDARKKKDNKEDIKKRVNKMLKKRGLDKAY